MKSLINSKKWAMMMVLMVLSVSSLLADEDDFLLSVRNVTHTANTIEFDLYLLDTDNTQTFEFAALQMGLLLNSSIYGSNTLTISYSNAGSGLDGDQQFAGSADVVAPLTGYEGKALIRLMANSIPPSPPGAGTGSLISSAGNGTLLAHFTIESTESFTANTRAGLEFCSGTAVSPLWPTVLYAYISGNSTPLSVTPGVDAIVDGDPLLNATLPALFDVTGSGSYCVGEDGLPVVLDGSELNTTYTLYREGLEVTTLSGTGTAISFVNQTAGTYTIYATNEAGTIQMTGQADITEIPLNTITLTSAVGTNNQTVCINAGITAITYETTGATGIGSGSGLPSGVTASWAANTITISGTPTESGIFGYSIPLTGGCGEISATGTIDVHTLPTITVTTAPVCSTDLLTYSFEVTVSSGSVQSSTGSVADLGGNVWGISGVAVGEGVTVTVTDANTCVNTVSVSSPDCSCPAVAAPVSGGDQSYCVGETIPSLTVTVGTGETADWYSEATEGTLLRSDNTTYTPTAAGTYYAEARVTENNCVSSTRTAVNLTENPLPTVTLGALPTVCVDAAAFTLTQGSPTGGTYSGPGITNGTAGLFDPSVAGADTHTITYSYTDGATGCSGSATNAITVHALPTITITTAPVCSTDLLTYSFEVTVSSGSVQSSTGSVADLGGNVWGISGVAVGEGVTVTVTDANTCVNTVSVSPPDCSCPAVAAPVSGGDQSYCAGETIPSLTVTVGAGETADWYSAATGGTLLLPGSITYTPTAPGTYYAEARVTENNCTSSTRTAVILTENPLPTPITGITTINIGTTTTLNSTPTSGTWSSEDETIALIDPVTGEVTGVAAGSSEIIYTLPTGCFVTTYITVELSGFNKSIPAGWSWFSVNVESEDMSLINVLSGCEADGNYIKDQYTSSTYYDGYGWFGYLTSVDPLKMYKIETTNNCSISYMGSPVEVSNSLELVAGWNWIGFLPQNELDINTALSSLYLTDLDYIKNQINSATYYSGYGWFGYLTEMVPGEGYMIRLSSPGTLIYPSQPATKSSAIIKEREEVQFNPSDYEYNASITACVVENDQVIGSDGDMLIAYINGQIRGIVTGLVFEPNGKYLFPIMVHNNAGGDTIKFKYLNAQEDKLYECNEDIEFKSDMIVADAIKPFKLTVSSKKNGNLVENPPGVNMSCYPNPFTEKVSIEFNVPYDLQVILAIYDSYGRIIKCLKNRREQPGNMLVNWIPDGQPEGVYVVYLQIGDHITVKKLTLVR